MLEHLVCTVRFWKLWMNNSFFVKVFSHYTFDKLSIFTCVWKRLFAVFQMPSNYKWLFWQVVLYENLIIFTHFFFSGRDYQHSLEMQKILKNVIQSVDVFLLLFSGASTRYEKNGENPNSSSVFFFKSSFVHPHHL